MCLKLSQTKIFPKTHSINSSLQSLERKGRKKYSYVSAVPGGRKKSHPGGRKSFFFAKKSWCIHKCLNTPYHRSTVTPTLWRQYAEDGKCTRKYYSFKILCTLKFRDRGFIHVSRSSIILALPYAKIFPCPPEFLIRISNTLGYGKGQNRINF